MHCLEYSAGAGIVALHLSQPIRVFLELPMEDKKRLTGLAGGEVMHDQYLDCCSRTYGSELLSSRRFAIAIMECLSQR